MGLDSNRPIYAIWNAFDMGAHIARMREKHPDWSQRQLTCCLYWQEGARNKLREEVRKFFNAQKPDGDGRVCRDMRIVPTPEALGVDVTATMKSIGIELEWPPRTVAYQVVLAGTKPKP